jgi:hypothetical protein
MLVGDAAGNQAAPLSLTRRPGAATLDGRCL